MMNNIINCLCSAEPICERKSFDSKAIDELIKYKCPNCKEKELPWLGQWKDCGALQEWNRIALKKSYHKRILEYNENGVCISEPYKTLEWRNKTKSCENLTIKFYHDNSMYYYCLSFYYLHHGHSFALWIGDRCYPTFEMAKKVAIRHVLKSDKNLRKIIEEFLLPAQGELFL